MGKKLPNHIVYQGRRIQTQRSSGRGCESLVARSAMIRLAGAAELPENIGGHERLVLGVIRQAVTDLCSGVIIERDNARHFFELAEEQGCWYFDSVGLDEHYVAATLRDMDLLPPAGWRVVH